MIIPKRDIKIASYKVANTDRQVYVLTRSSIKKNLDDVGTHLVSQKVVLTSCAEKEYTLAFDMKAERLQNFRKDYNIHKASVEDLLKYCKGNNTSLVVMDDHSWKRYDPGCDIMSVHKVQIKFLEGVDII